MTGSEQAVIDYSLCDEYSQLRDYFYYDIVLDTGVRFLCSRYVSDNFEVPVYDRVVCTICDLIYYIPKDRVVWFRTSNLDQAKHSYSNNARIYQRMKTKAQDE